MVGTVIVHQGKVVRPSQLIASVRRTLEWEEGMRSRPQLIVVVLSIVLGGALASGQEAPAGVVVSTMGQIDEQKAKAMGLTLQYDVAPMPITASCPANSVNGLEDGMGGKVLLEVVVDRRGRATQARVLRSRSGLDAAAVRCVLGSRFRPAQKNGRAVGTVAQAEVAFRLSGQLTVTPQEARQR